MWLVIGWCVDQHRVVGPFESVSPPTSDQVESLLPSYEWNHAVAFEVSGVVIRDPRKADEVVSRSREAFADALA
jgi:hypothetical protein